MAKERPHTSVRPAQAFDERMRTWVHASQVRDAIAAILRVTTLCDVCAALAQRSVN